MVVNKHTDAIRIGLAKQAADVAWNPRYTVYAKLHGKDEEEMLAHDREVWPGGCMLGFMLWIQHHTRAYCKAYPERHFHNWNGTPVSGSFGDADLFDAWLRENAKVIE